MRKILVLGGTQYFGKRLVWKWLEEDAQVTVATRGNKPNPFGDRVTWAVVDRLDRSSMEAALAGGEWDIIYDQSCYSPQEALDCAQLFAGRTKRYIFTSTMSVYDFGPDLREDAYDPYHYPIRIKPRHVYEGWQGYKEAKRAAEAVLFQRADFSVAAVRVPIVLGPDDYTRRLHFHVEHVKNRQAIGLPNVDARISFIHAGEACSFLHWIGNTAYEGPFNAAAMGDISIRELLGMIETTVGEKAIIAAVTEHEHQSPFGLETSWTLNTDKAQRHGFVFDELLSWLPKLISEISKADSVQ